VVVCGFAEDDHVRDGFVELCLGELIEHLSPVWRVSKEGLCQDFCCSDADFHINIREIDAPIGA
jgi:hypothetical protein